MTFSGIEIRKTQMAVLLDKHIVVVGRVIKSG